MSQVGGVLATAAAAIARGALALKDAYLNLVARFGWKALAVTAVVAILVVALAASGVRGCAAQRGSTSASQPTAQSQQTSSLSSQAAGTASGANTTAASTTSSDAESTQAGAGASVTAATPLQLIVQSRPTIDDTQIDEEYLVNILGEDFASMLMSQASSNNDAHWIAAHPDEYLEDGTIVRYKMLRLAAKEPQAVSFVRDWPEKYCADAPNYDESHADESSNGVPRLYQWDKRWGYTEYSSTTFALTGCAPTSMAMVYQAITGDASMSPYDMGVYAANAGYATQFDGTDGSFFSYGAAGLGLTCTELNVDAGSLWQALADGAVVVVNVGPGDFTDSGHYFVATGLADDGGIAVNDPFSAERSAQTWNLDAVVGQTRALYAFS